MRRAVFLLLAALTLQAETRITGQVLNSATNAPIPNAVVSAQFGNSDVDTFGFHRRDADLIHPTRTLTDDFGRFSLEADPELLSLHLAISHPGFRSEDNRDTATVTVRPSDAREIRVRLTPVSVIHGVIQDPAAAPLPGISVQAIRTEIREGRQLRTPFATLKTNPFGEYTFDGLPAGTYFLRASAETYGPTYYPAATHPDSAQSVDVAPGKAVTANFTLENHPTFHVTGIITNPPPRRPLAMRLLLGDDALDNSAFVGPNGTFEMLNVAPGSYMLQAYTPNSTPPDFGEIMITVADHDVPGVKIALSPGLDVSGHVEFRGPAGAEHYAQIRALAVDPRRWPVNVAEPSVVINNRGNFLLKNLLPGQYEVTVHGLPDFYVADINAASFTVTKTDAPHLNIVMQSGGGQIEGTIEGPPGNFEVALISRESPAHIPTIVHATAGRFHATGLTPGEYTLYAWRESRQLEYRNPWTLSSLSAYAVPVIVTDGAKHTVTLTPVP